MRLRSLTLVVGSLLGLAGAAHADPLPDLSWLGGDCPPVR
jgi:hypothetical protein